MTCPYGVVVRVGATLAVAPGDSSVGRRKACPYGTEAILQEIIYYCSLELEQKQP
jgi:hypothetical protein